MVNYKAGGRTRLSGVFFSLFTLSIILLFARYIQYIPKAVISGMSLMVAIIVLDKWSLKLLKDVLKKGSKSRKEILMNISIIFLVMFAVIFFNMIVAVAIGIGLSIIMFVEQMSKSIIRNVFGGSKFHSKKQRYIKVMELLEAHGKQIAIIELEGALFFGATDNLVNIIDRLVKKGICYIILDMKRINRIDVSGEKVLKQTYSQLKKKDVTLVFSYIYSGSTLWDFLKDLGFIKEINQNHLFTDTDLAIEYCEDKLIYKITPEQLKGSKFELHEFLGLKKTDRNSLTQIEKYMKKINFKKGELIFKQGDPGDAAFVIVEGSANITIKLPGAKRTKRLTTLSYGTIFGEMALLDRGTRSANVKAIEDIVCYKISSTNFEKMKKEAPDSAMIIRNTISKILVTRLRQANATIAELER